MQDTEEIWKDVVGYEGLYQVSSIGRVKSSFIRKGFSGFLKPALKTYPSSAPYLFVLLSKKGKHKFETIHSLMANAFFGIDKTKVTDHINNISTDNRLSNLQRITIRQNNTKDRKGGTSRYAGVYWNKKLSKWGVKIGVKNKKIWLGSFSDEQKAAEAYQNALKNLLPNG